MNVGPPIVVIGYLAVLHRLRAPRLPWGGGEGEVCQPLLSSLTCDAPLVAAHLNALGVRAGYVLSHPGRRPLDALLLGLLPLWADPIRVGPWRGDPTEWEISTDDGQRVWFNCPTAGVESLRECAAGTALPGSLVYVDAYPWLASASIDVLSAIRPTGTVLVNFGRMDGQTARQYVISCKRRLPNADILPQVCAPDLTSDVSRRSVFRQVCEETGCPLALITSNGEGLGLGGSDRFHWWAPPRHVAVTDTSGAGAAVSATLLHHLLQRGGQWSEDTVRRLGEAGLRQCWVDGALPLAAQAEWNAHERRTRHDPSLSYDPATIGTTVPKTTFIDDDNRREGY